MRVKALSLVLLLLILFSLGVRHLPLNSEKVGENGLTKQDIVEVYDTLQKYTGLPGGIPTLIVEDNPVINAWITPNALTITTGMLNFVKNKDELAAVIGHEMGHYMLQHFELGGDSRIHEANADKFGVFLMLRAGYNVCDAEQIWERFDDKFGDPIMTDSHPSPAQRAWELKFPSCH